MRNKALYGADAETYRPARWLEATPRQLAEWEKYDFHWGYGNRTCMGKHIATMEIYKVTLEVRIPAVVLFQSWRLLGRYFLCDRC